MKLAKSIIIGDKVIPAGSDLVFDHTGLAEYDGIKVMLSQIPDGALQEFELETATEVVDANVSTEAIVLKSKGQLAVDMLINALITILSACPPEDRNNLRKVLTAARQASTTSDPGRNFKHLLKIDK